MKKLTFLSLLLASIVGTRGDSITAAMISAGTVNLSNGSVVNIGQPFVGVTSAAGAATFNFFTVRRFDSVL